MILPKPELLAGLAEEAAELAQAALKLRRVLDGSNPTPKPQEEAEADLLEEVADTALYLSQLDISFQRISEIMLTKQERWNERLKGR